MRKGRASDLLSTLPHAEFQRLLVAGLEPVTLNFGEVLHDPGMPLRYVYFPIDCVIALLTSQTGHQVVEVALVGNGGMVGVPLALGIHASTRRALVQGPGTAMRMEAAAFRKVCLHSKPLEQRLFRYKHALVGEIAQAAACNRFHSVQARFVRYLLMTADCARSRELRVTQKFLAHMLGVRRVGVTIAACALHKRKLISCGRGVITILDRKGLRAVCCECYQIIKRIYGSAYADD